MLAREIVFEFGAELVFHFSRLLYLFYLDAQEIEVRTDLTPK